MVGMENVKEKIRKLLALSESDNEHEAKAALLKAKMLMAQHKISEKELDELQSKKVKQINTQYTCSKRKEAWMVGLSGTIAENFCCKAIRTRQRRKQTNFISFIGLEEDVDMCVEIFKYAVSCIRSGIERIKENAANKDKKILSDSYGFGFVYGVKEAFDLQKEKDETGWGLVMCVPEEVNNAVKDYGHEKFSELKKDKISYKEFQNGYTDGQKFSPETKLESR